MDMNVLALAFIILLVFAKSLQVISSPKPLQRSYS